MKKQLKSALQENTKINLNKRTISNLDVSEMSKHLGGLNARVVEKGPPLTKRCQGW